MNQVFKIKAKIKVNEEGGRRSPIKSRYRPGFLFDSHGQTSGQITLLDADCLSPGDVGIVEVCFVSDVLLGDIYPGTFFKFYEGPVEIGIGKVLEVIGWAEKC